MDIVFKLILFLLINLAALGYLLFELIELGNPYRQALRMAWDLIVLSGNGNQTSSISVKMNWVHLLRKAWWLMVLLYFLFWITSGQYYSNLLILVLLLLHGYWYIHAAIHPVKAQDQILFTNDNWGVVYTGIDPHSRWDQKSLAELDLRKKNLLVLAVEHQGQLLPFPKGSEVLFPDDRVLLFGEMSSYREVNR
jgi:hypothetical protein